MTEQSEAIGVLTQVGIDVSDLGRAEEFYSALLGIKRAAAHDQYLNFEPLPGGLTVYLQRVLFESGVYPKLKGADNGQDY